MRNKIYQFKITLSGTKPSIWRRIQVPQTYTFWDLHVAIQNSMGWLDCHLHEFIILNPKTLTISHIGIPDDVGLEGVKILAGWEKKISTYFTANNPPAKYTYDFGDNWEHKIIFEKILPKENGLLYPRCIKGKRACPPEDCGGIWGYKELLEILKNPTHKDYEEALEWLGESFDPEEFTPETVIFTDPKESYRPTFTK